MIIFKAGNRFINLDLLVDAQPSPEGSLALVMTAPGLSLEGAYKIFLSGGEAESLLAYLGSKAVNRPSPPSGGINVF